MTALEDVPDWGGALMQWHVHDDLCLTDEPVDPQVEGLTEPDGTCRPPLVKHQETALIHVWIVPHECGPFAALEGVGAESIEEGAQRWCDHAHGSLVWRQPMTIVAFARRADDAVRTKRAAAPN